MTDSRKLATIVAALRAWQGQKSIQGPLSPLDTEKITTDNGRFQPLSSAEIDELCVELNAAPARRLVVTLEGGLVSCVLSSDAEAEVAVIDYDTDPNAEPDELAYIPQGDGSFSDAHVFITSTEVNPARVAELFASLPTDGDDEEGEVAS
jgi:hypothetical protein